MRTERLILRPFEARDRADFATLHADPRVMADQGGPLSRAASDAKFDRYLACQEASGFSRQAVEAAGMPELLGYCGVMPLPGPDHPLWPCLQIGWRFHVAAWGQGYATEAARAVLAGTYGQRVLAFTAQGNRRSVAVMARLVLRREPMLDFPAEGARILVWSAP